MEWIGWLAFIFAIISSSRVGELERRIKKNEKMIKAEKMKKEKKKEKKKNAISYEDTKDLSAYDEIIHFGGLYVGGVKGLKNTIKALPEHANLIIVTVGLADVSNKENTDHIKESVRQQVPQPIFDRTRILHLRGGMDYSKLSFMHKTMMSFVYKKAKNTPEEQKTAEVRDMIATYNQKVDFADFGTLQQVIDIV